MFIGDFTTVNWLLHRCENSLFRAVTTNSPSKTPFKGAITFNLTPKKSWKMPNKRLDCLLKMISLKFYQSNLENLDVLMKKLT